MTVTAVVVSYRRVYHRCHYLHFVHNNNTVLEDLLRVEKKDGAPRLDRCSLQPLMYTINDRLALAIFSRHNNIILMIIL